MKTTFQTMATLAMTLAVTLPQAWAQLSIPSDGSDGALIITSNTVIDLSQAITGNWDADNSANAGKGIYDPNKWAVVFKYTSVNVASNTTVTFINHSTRAPLVWLVSSNVVINGTVSLNGQNLNLNTANVTEPGPGGFRGGALAQSGLARGGGFGPGGYPSDHGAYSTYHPYGNSQILPLIGGSGGSGGVYGSGASYNGGAGGGAILIGVSGSISVNGLLVANGGAGSGDMGYGGYGSGGAVRIVADQILGSGKVEATSGVYPGRIRLEANSASATLSLNPPSAAVAPAPLVIWPPTNAPVVKVVSVASQAAPLDPKASISAGGSDVTIASSGSVQIQLQTQNFPTNGTVNVYVKPRNAAQSILSASFVSGDTNSALWQVSTTLPVNQSVIQARAVAN